VQVLECDSSHRRNTPIRLILYLPKLALHGAEVFDLLCFSCGLDSKSSGERVSGCVDALFYIALNLQASNLPRLQDVPGIDVSLSVEHNSVVLMR
jgi:hypothetical protein